MGLSQVVKAGVVQGNTFQKIFEYSKKNNFAIPCINVINGDSINAVLEAASNSNSSIIVQISKENAKLFSGKVSKNDASILGAINAANHIHTVASSYKIPVILTTDYVSSQNLDWINELLNIGSDYYKHHGRAMYSSYAIDVSEESYLDSIKIAKKYLKKASKIGMGLEIKINVNYVNSNELSHLYEELQKISTNFMISFSFLDEELSDKRIMFLELQKMIEKNLRLKSKPLNLVFNGDYCLKKEIREIINTGVVKVNLDSSIKNAFSDGLNNYDEDRQENSSIGKYVEPKKWLREIQKMIIKKVNSSIKEYNAKNTL